MTVPRPLVAAAIAGAFAIGVVAVARTAVFGGPAQGSPEAALPLLVMGAAMSVTGLTIRRHPSLAWVAIVATLSIAAVDLASLARASRPTMTDDAWRTLAVAVAVTAIGASAVAIGYAVDRSRRLGAWVPLVGALALVALSLASIWALATMDATAATVAASDESDTLGNVRVVTRIFLATVLGFLVLGMLGDARPAAIRARRRVAATRPGPRTARERLAYGGAWAWALMDEGAPGRSRAHRAAVSERSRIARELHAEVVPAVRRALAEAERDGSVERLAASLRDVLREVDALVESRHPIQLEVGGLVAAIEWLAERAEERGDLEVIIDVVDEPSRAAGRPPADVAGAAFRVADLALENGIRHAPGSTVRIEVLAASDEVRLTVADDGPGFDVVAPPTADPTSGRGIADMHAEALACDAIVDIRSRDGAPGTTVTFRWPAPTRADTGRPATPGR